MLQLRVNLPANFENDSGDLTQEGLDWMLMYQALLEKNDFTEFKVVRVKV